MIFAIYAVAAGIKVEFVPVAAQHLRHDIFHDHTFIDIKPVKENRLVQFIVGESSVHKSMRDKQAGICHVTFL